MGHGKSQHVPNFEVLFLRVCKIRVVSHRATGPTPGRAPLGPRRLQGAAVGQDGRSSSLTAPNGPAQAALVASALARAATAPGLVAMVAVHGTGTPLGDPIGAPPSPDEVPDATAWHAHRDAALPGASIVFKAGVFLLCSRISQVESRQVIY